MARIQTLHGETDVPDYLVELVRNRTKKTWWLPFPALKAKLNKRGFKTLIQALLKEKLGRHKSKRKNRSRKLKPLPHIVKYETLRQRVGRLPR